jgi:iron complex outermembrane receptor protein
MMAQGGVGAAVWLGFVLAFYEAPATAQTSPGQARAVPEIIVTANRREESVQDSSLSIDVVDGAEVEAVGVVQATDLPALVPGLSVSLGGASVQTYLRGVGSFSTDASAESAIAYSINGVYISRPIGLGPIFFDLERIEVVKGPQGTLYGRNASGGAINLITRRPEFKPALEATLSLGSHDLFRVQGSAGAGLTDRLALRVAGQRVIRDGYLSDGYKDEDSRAARFTALWRPSQAVSLLLTGELAGQGGMGEAPVKRSLLAPVPSDPWQGPSIGSIQQPPTAFLPGGARFGGDGFLDADLAAASAALEADLGPMTLTFIPAYRDVRVKARNYLPGFPFDRRETSDQHSHELRLGNEAGGLSWVAGLYHFREDQTQVYTLRSPPLQQLIVDTPLSTRSYAAFGEATVEIAGSVRLIAGGRYTRERKRQGGTTVTILPAPAVTDNGGRRSFSDFSWKLGLEVDLDARHMLFATAATGFKAGGFFPSVPAPDNSFGPEKLAAYTLGSRNRFFDGRFQLNGEAFYWTYDDKQERFLGATPVGVGLLTTNAGQATVYGGSLDLVFQPSARDTFRGTVEYLRSRYDDFSFRVYNPSVGPFINSFAPEGTGCALGPVVPFTANDAVPALRGDSTQIIDCSGKPLPRAPKWSGSAGYERLVPLGGRLRLRARVDGDFASSQYLTPDFIGSGRDDGFLLLGASLMLEDGPLSATAWARNITNEVVYSGGFRYSFSRPRAAGGDPTLFYANIRPPRTYGITFRAGF